MAAAAVLLAALAAGLELPLAGAAPLAPGARVAAAVSTSVLGAGPGAAAAAVSTSAPGAGPGAVAL
ncbi:MAG TPA: hypothetical protein VHR45_01230, partial [Thermoanaerobaculia bacterium]|nr:hypothetical protein [Thermoanaerobaculia bacterium]